MAIDFFQHQDLARKKTGTLVAYFVLAVICIIAAVYLAFVVILFAGRNVGKDEGDRAEFDPAMLWQPDVLAAVGLGTLALVGGGTAYRVSSLKGGGHSVAELLGGRPVEPDTTDPDERRLLNVVEEMAIASGTPVPPVYLLDRENGINAFAAGHDPSDAVIGVTRGAVQTLSRDELQGVIAHEFSHILNGDMRLNIKLMGWLYGILLISVVGWVLFRSTSGGWYYVRDRDDDKKGGNPLPLLGLALYAIGYIGVVFGRLIKAAISRQREYLADASAVQFTRNPDGIAGALKKIGALSDGSRVRDPEAEEASHMFFGEALGLSGWNPMASHPPLVDRIRRIDPQFDGDFSEVSLEPPTHAKVAAATAQATQARARARSRDPLKFNPVEAITRVGTLGPQNLAYAAALLDSIPEGVKAGAREPFGAVALVYGLLLDPDAEIRRAQLDRLSQHAAPPALQELKRILPGLAAIDAEARLPLVELAIPSLKRLTREQFHDFVENIRHLMEADQQISLFEYALRRMLLRHLGPLYGWGERPSVRHNSPEPLMGPSAVVLSALARAGESSPEGQARAFEVGASALGWPVGGMLPEPQSGLKAVDEALKVVGSAAPLLKKRVLTACAACIGADGKVTLEEGELLRAVADSLDCPMPPLMSGAPLA
jgi:Zn-dependent protease with chaperone function